MARGLRSLCHMAPIATKYEDLICWQLSAQLRDEIVKLTNDGRAARDVEFSKQIRKSSSSSASNMAEGFGAFYPKEFARFGRIARRSLIETRNHLRDGQKRGYFSEATTNKLVHISFRSQKALTRLIKYLDSLKDRPPGGWEVK